MYKKLEAARAQIEDKTLIPKPLGDYNLKDAMGLKDDKRLYNACQVSLCSISFNTIHQH